MTLLLFSFWHRSLVNVHTDLHGSIASGCLCKSRPLQWCLMYLSRLSGCLKRSQRGTPSSGISLLGTKSDQQVLNLAKTEGCQAQSLFVGPKTAWRLSRYVKECGIKREQIFRFRKSLTAIFLTVSLPMFTSSASILSERWRFWSNNWEIISTLLSLRHSVGRPLLGSSSMSSHPSRNRPYQWKTSNMIVLGPHTLHLPSGEFPLHFFQL